MKSVCDRCWIADPKLVPSLKLLCLMLKLRNSNTQLFTVPQEQNQSWEYLNRFQGKTCNTRETILVETSLKRIAFLMWAIQDTGVGVISWHSFPLRNHKQLWKWERNHIKNKFLYFQFSYFLGFLLLFLIFNNINNLNITNKTNKSSLRGSRYSKRKVVDLIIDFIVFRQCNSRFCQN